MSERAALLGLIAGLTADDFGQHGPVAETRQLLQAVSTEDAGWRLRAALILFQAGAHAPARQLARAFVLAIGHPDPAVREQRTVLAWVCLGLGDHAPLERFVRVCYQAEVTVTLGEAPADGYRGAVAWHLAGGRSTFVFHPAIADYAELGAVAQHWAAELPLLLAYARAHPNAVGSVQLNLEDIAGRPGLTYSDHRSDHFLVPDPTFMASDGYRDLRAALDKAAPAWEQRRPVAYWRGATTGWVGCNGTKAASWQALPRAVLCTVARSGLACAHFNVALSLVTQLSTQAAAEVRQSGLMAAYEPTTQLMEYRFQIDIDGNTNAWKSLFLKLYSGSTVLKVESAKGLRQWYYDRLKPWWNYVPVRADMSDLHDVMAWLLAHQDAARAIGERGRTVAMAMTMDGEIAAAFPTISAALAQAAYSEAKARSPAPGLTVV